MKISGDKFTLEEIKAGKVEIKEGPFIVGVKNENKEGLLAELKDSWNWEPTAVFF